MLTTNQVRFHALNTAFVFTDGLVMFVNIEGIIVGIKGILKNQKVR